MISASGLLVTAFSVLGLRAAGLASPAPVAGAAEVAPAPLPEPDLPHGPYEPDPLARNESLFTAVAGALREAGYLHG